MIYHPKNLRIHDCPRMARDRPTDSARSAVSGLHISRFVCHVRKLLLTRHRKAETDRGERERWPWQSTSVQTSLAHSRMRIQCSPFGIIFPMMFSGAQPKQSGVSFSWSEKDAVFENTFQIGRCQENIVFLAPRERWTAPFSSNFRKHHRKDDAKRKTSNSHPGMSFRRLTWLVSHGREELGCSTAHRAIACLPKFVCTRALRTKRSAAHVDLYVN